MAIDKYTVEQVTELVADIDADLAQLNASMARAKADGDDHTYRQLVKSYAEAKGSRRNLEIEYNEYVRDNTPRQPKPKRELTWEEFKAKPIEEMDEADAIRMCGVTPEQYYEGKRRAAAELASRKAGEQSQ
jgi:hypothetical protein